MDCHIFTRAELADPTDVQQPVVLLTGAWPHGSCPSVLELDNVIARRFVWIDREAGRLAQRAGVTDPLDRVPRLPEAWVNVLALRYYLVKLLRVIAFFSEVRPPNSNDRIRVIAAQADRDDVAIIATICRRAGAHCEVQWRGAQTVAEKPTAHQEWWRRTLTRLASHFRLPIENRTNGPRVVMCGNPRFLDPLCKVLHERNCRIWWLYDRFAVKPYLRWRARGVDQLTCEEGSLPSDVQQTEPSKLPSLMFRGIELRGLVANWLKTRLATRQDDQLRWQERIDSHFRQIRPDLLLLDEDATPMKRIALSAARKRGGESYVLQHGAPVARFGFAPLAADGIFAWGQSSRSQFEKWEIPSERIFVTGSPSHDVMVSALRKAVRTKPTFDDSPCILLLATVPPRDDRPDVVEMNMNRRTYGEMIEAAFAAVESVPGAVLVVKPHPRTGKDPIVDAAIERHPNLAVKLLRGGSLSQSLRGVHCVLSCLSSAGIEATVADVPVVQLVPRGLGAILPHDCWGLFGSASDAETLKPLLQAACRGNARATTGNLRNVFANACSWKRGSDNVRHAAERIADVLCDRLVMKGTANQSPVALRTNRKQGCPEAIVDR